MTTVDCERQWVDGRLVPSRMILDFDGFGVMTHLIPLDLKRIEVPWSDRGRDDAPIDDFLSFGVEIHAWGS